MKPYSAAVIFGCIILLLTCTSDVPHSPNPGILRLYMVTNPADTLAYMGLDTLRVKSGDQFLLRISQRKVFRADSVYAVVFNSLMANHETEDTYNVFKRQERSFVRHLIGEAQLPPDTFIEIQFVVYPDPMVVVGGVGFPIQPVDNYDPLIRLTHTFHIRENDTTEVTIQFNAFQSIKRWRDTYLFDPSFEILK